MNLLNELFDKFTSFLAKPQIDYNNLMGELTNNRIKNNAENNRWKETELEKIRQADLPLMPVYGPPAPTQKPAQTTQGTINPLYTNFLNNVLNGRTQQQANVPQDLRDASNTAATKYNMPASILLALANTETGMKNINEIGGGLGRGYFQIDLGQHPNITQDQAMDPNFAADYAANLLNNRVSRYNNVSNGVRKYNGGLKNPKTLDYLNKYIENLGNYSY